ncbi:hypothetical protein BJX61DRAFT_546601 [Aspergillus egyptiacus]|nr:hypothetical protein BJX61DRAFT_546601 [Aspergillus egyptiacus]
MAHENQTGAAADVVITSHGPQDSQLEIKNIRIPNMSAGNFLGLKFDAPMALSHAWTNFADQVQVKYQPSKEPQAGASYLIEAWIPSLIRALEPADTITFEFPADIGSGTEPFKKSLEIGLGKIPSKPVVTTGTVVIHCPDPGDDQLKKETQVLVFRKKDHDGHETRITVSPGQTVKHELDPGTYAVEALELKTELETVVRKAAIVSPDAHAVSVDAGSKVDIQVGYVGEVEYYGALDVTFEADPPFDTALKVGWLGHEGGLVQTFETRSGTIKFRRLEIGGEYSIHHDPLFSYNNIKYSYPSKAVKLTPQEPYGRITFQAPTPGEPLSDNIVEVVVNVTPTFHIPFSLRLESFMALYDVTVEKPEQSFRVVVTKGYYSAASRGYTYNGAAYTVKGPSSFFPQFGTPLVLEVVPAGKPAQQ